jgi:hypothetical protein
LLKFKIKNDCINGESLDLKLPKIKTFELNDIQKDQVNFRVLRMKRITYDPIRCSKSIKLDKVLLRKKINRPIARYQTDKTEILDE